MSEQTINATKDSRFRCPVPGTHFRHGTTTIDITKLSERKALRLAADPTCKFLYLAEAKGKVPATVEPPAAEPDTKGKGK